MSDPKRTYESDSPIWGSMSLSPRPKQVSRVRQKSRFDPRNWKIPCDVDTVLRIIDRIQEL